MNIRGFTKSSFIDYPGNICSLVFLGGCNFRCSYCHNPELVYNETPLLDTGFVIGKLKDNRKWTNAVCISGGEPTLYAELYHFIKLLKKMGFLVKLDTNGSNPGMLLNLTENGLIDYIAMDIKAPYPKYEDIVNTVVDTDRIKESVKIILSSGIPHEFRTTVCRELIEKEDILRITEQIKGARVYAIQNFRDISILDRTKRLTSYSPAELEEFKELVSNRFEKVFVRK